MSDIDAHLAITGCVHDTLSTLSELLHLPPILLGDAVLDDMLLAYDNAVGGSGV